MIPMRYIKAWRHQANWPTDAQVEQDLIISRALVEMYKQPKIFEALAFRGGTALNKLFFYPAARYSEDIDLVQMRAEPIGDTLIAIREALDHWLGIPKWEQKQGRVKLFYQISSEITQRPLKLKIEINTDEHFSVLDLNEVDYSVLSEWFFGETKIKTFQFDELIGSKFCALYQRKKGRDVFDLWMALQHTNLRIDQVIEVFNSHLKKKNRRVTRAQFEKNLFSKLTDNNFTQDIEPLLKGGIEWDIHHGVNQVHEKLICRLPGNPWKNLESHH